MPDTTSSTSLKKDRHVKPKTTPIFQISLLENTRCCGQDNFVAAKKKKTETYIITATNVSFENLLR
jgi:hypothetical protein